MGIRRTLVACTGRIPHPNNVLAVGGSASSARHPIMYILIPQLLFLSVFSNRHDGRTHAERWWRHGADPAPWDAVSNLLLMSDATAFREELSFLESGTRVLQEQFIEIESLWSQVGALERCVCDSTLYVRKWLRELAAHCPVADEATLTALFERVNEAARVSSGGLGTASAVAVGTTVPKDPRDSGLLAARSGPAAKESLREAGQRAASSALKVCSKAERDRKEVRKLLSKLENQRLRTDPQLEAVLMLLWRNRPAGLYVHDLMQETRLSRMRLNTFLHALVKSGLVQKQARKGLIYSLCREHCG